MRTSRVFPALLALCTMLGPLGIDTYLPSFHAIGREFAVSPAAVQQTLSAYVVAMAITMLFYGAISDALGRRPVLMFAAVGYCVTSLLAMLVSSIEALIAIRFAQGAMAGAGMVITRAMIQDRFQGPDAQRLQAMVMMMFGVAPAIAPVLGGWIQHLGGWRSTFAFLALFGAFLALMCWRVMPETLAPEKRLPLRLGSMAANYAQALRNGRFRLMLLGVGLMAGANAIYISSAAEFVVTVLGLSETSFGWLFIPLIAGTVLGSALSRSLARRVSLPVQKRLGLSCIVLACLSNVAYHCVVDQPSVPGAVLPIMFYTFGISQLMPIFSMQIIGTFPHMRGLASSLQGFTQMTVFATMAGLVVPHLFHSGLALALGQTTAVVSGALLLWWSSKRPA